MQQLIIIDDHELIAKGIGNHFANQHEFHVLGVYANPNEGLNKIELLQPDIVITDLDMPGMNGLELIASARKISSKTRFVLLTMHLSKQLFHKVRELSIEGYLPKNTDEDELILCVEQVAKGKTYYSQKLMDLISNHDLPEKSPEGVLKLTQMLTDREREILILVAEGYSTKEIGDQLHLAAKTIETHRKNIMNKLEVHNVAGMVRIAVKEGLMD